VFARPGIYLGEKSLRAVVAYLDGFNIARGGAPLLGFHEWLVVRVNGGTNIHWHALAELLRPVEARSDADHGEDARIAALGRVVEEYLRYRQENGLTKVFYDYGRWLLRKRWYDGPLRRKDGKPG
jgi:hypothetical protein